MSNIAANTRLEQSFRKNWDRPALTNYGESTCTYGELAQMVARLHSFFEKNSISAGDMVAICSKNQANWLVSFLAAYTYGAVPVPILHDFKAANIKNLVSHSEAKMLFADDSVISELNIGEFSSLRAVVSVNDFSTISPDGTKGISALEAASDIFDKAYPSGYSASDIKYVQRDPEALAILNYTSGTSGFSKGVMIPGRCVDSNMYFATIAASYMNEQSKLVVMLPMAHMYGLMFEVFYEITRGTHLYFLTRMPTPKVLLKAMAEIRPNLIVSVPLVLEKVFKSNIKPQIDKPVIKFLLKLPLLRSLVRRSIRKKVIEAFGGNFEEIIIGGAALNKEVETFLYEIKFPFTIGYGMTECGPIIAYAHWNRTKLHSCGPAAPGMQIRINSYDPSRVPGEVLVKGDNVFLGYFKNEEATSEAFVSDGWFKTGDMGVLDSDGYIFLRGRCKCMLLGPSGQNIYPEEIECSLNNCDYVIDSLVIEDDGAMVALIYPDFRKALSDGYDAQGLQKILEKEILVDLNKELPNYCRLKSVEILPEDFERTPKRSIKRYLYQR